MLRSWRKEIHIGLVDGHAWITDGLGRETSVPTPVDNAPLLKPTLESALDHFDHSIPKGARIALIVGDARASIISLPWQQGLNRACELERYAQICFERSGITITTEDAMHAEFRHYGATGLAYALRRESLLDVEDACRQRGFSLARAMPVTAAAYYALKPPGKRERSVVLLCEARRITALVFGATGLDGYEVEPVVPSPEGTATRLLRRVSALYGASGYIGLWPPSSAESQNIPTVIAAEYPDLELHLIKTEALHG